MKQQDPSRPARHRIHLPKPLAAYKIGLFLGLFAAALASVSTGFYVENRRHARMQAEQNLATQAELDLEQISLWLAERRGDAEVIEDDPMLAEFLERVLAPQPGSSNVEAMRTWLAASRKYYKYRTAAIFDTAGHLRLSDPLGPEMGHGNTSQGFRQAVQSGSLVFSDLHLNSLGQPQIDIWVPVHRAGAKPVAVLLLAIDPRTYLYPLLETRPSGSRTGETLLVRREGGEVRILSDVRGKPGTAWRLKLAANRATPAGLAGLGIEGFFEARDYGGKPVLAVTRRIPGTNWGLVVKIDSEEAYQRSQQRLLTGITLSGLLLLMASFGIYSVVQRQAADFYRTRYEAEADRNSLAERYAFLVQFAADILFLLDSSGHFIEVNERTLSAYGYSREEFLTLSVDRLRAPSHAKSAEEIVASIRGAGDAGLVFETVHQRRDGSTFPVEISTRRLLFQGKECFLALIRDITARRETEGALRRSERKYRTLVEQLPAVTYMARDGSPESPTIYVSPQIQGFVGFSQEEWTALPSRWSRQLHPEDRARTMAAVEKFLSSGGQWSVEYRLLRRDGSVIWCRDQAVLIPGEGGSPGYVHGLLFDITERKNIEQLLRVSQDRLLMAQEAAGVSVWDWQVGTNEPQGHSAFDAQVGASYETWLEQIDPEDRARVVGNLQLALRGVQEFRVDYRTAPGEGCRWLASRAHVIFEGGRPVRLLGATMDITDLKKSEMEIHRMNQVLRYLAGSLLRSQDEERRRIAVELHESLGQMLAALTMDLGLLKASLKTADDRVSGLIEETAALGDRCCREVRTLSYVLHPPLLDELGLASALRSFVDGFVEHAGIVVDLVIESDLGRMDREIEITLFRIVQEALIQIHHHTGSPDAALRIFRAARHVVLTIEDHGTATFPEVAQTTGDSILRIGTGLAGMRERAAELGGRMDIESLPGRTIISVILPLPVRAIGPGT